MAIRLSSNPNAKIDVYKQTEKQQHDFDNAMDSLKETYPRIHNMIELMWGERDLHDRLTKMLQADSEGREGFPLSVFTALMIINDAHMTEFGFDVAGFGDFSKRDKW